MHGTWEISDHAFENWLVVVATVVTTASMVYRYIAFRGHPAFSDAVDAHQAALLAGGPQLAVYSALGELRRVGAVEANPNRVLSPVAPAPMDATRLERAIYEATAGGLTAVQLPSHPTVSVTLARIRDGLEQAGLLLTPTQRARARWFVYAQLLVVGVGVARVAADLISGAPVGDLLSAIALIGLFVTFMVTVPKRTRAGAAVLAELRRRHADLTPPRPVIETGVLATRLTRRRHPPRKPPLDAPGVAAFAIGLFGVESLYALDPVFASDVGAPRHRPTYDAISLGGTGG